MAPPYDRISVTLPPGLLQAADRVAARLDRPRSWVIAEALRRFTGAALPGAPAPAPREPGPEHLDRTPEERLRLAEALIAAARRSAPPARRARAQIVAFDTLDDFGAWKAARGRSA
jgi:hypothetical protein